MRQRNVKNKKEIIMNSCYVVPDPINWCGKWHCLFNNNNPIHLEIGMGKGDFIIEKALRYPNINFIGIEKYDSILALALNKMDKLVISNLKVIRMDAINVNEIFNNEIAVLYLNFSDPWPKKRHAERRLTSSTFLKCYDNLFLADKTIIMKTDNRHLFEYSLISFNLNGYLINEISLDLENSDIPDNIMTEYERKFSNLNNLIYYVKVVKTK